MKLLCVILNYKTADMTLDAIRAARTALTTLDHRIDVVDNDSQDGSFERLTAAVADAGWPDVRVVQSGHNGGFGAGNNVALRAALLEPEPPEFLYILNSDAFPAPDAIEALVSFLEQHPRAGIAGSFIHGPDGDPHLTAFRFPSVASEALSGFRLGVLKRLLPEREVPIHPMPSATQRVDWLAGASMMFRREVLQEIGLFDETFFLYFEETDLCRRAQLAGWECWYVMESRVAHIGSVSTGMKNKSRPMPRYWFDSRRHYFTKNHGAAYTWAANVAHAAGLLTFKARAGLQKKPDPDPVNFLQDFARYNFVDKRPR
jgi:N-acetylglucosaminyl-diphospho-decaprenol L-rhamnosyltransferase